jgi:hypothetical protein
LAQARRRGARRRPPRSPRQFSICCERKEVGANTFSIDIRFRSIMALIASHTTLGGQMQRRLTITAALAVILASGCAWAGMDEARRWLDREFQPSTLSKDQQLKEMEWFVNAATPFKGMEINVLSETIPTHEYESKTLTKAFEEITGIKVNHQVLGEGEVVQAVQTQMQTNRNLYDG